jgi:hypothetical protein
VQHILIDRPNALQAGHWEPVNYCHGDCPQSLEQITFKTNCWIVVGVREHVEAELAGMLEIDLFGTRLTALKEHWFLLQQICLDETFAAIQYERASLES